MLADKGRRTYSFDNFLVPVATAYGEFDGVEALGMLTMSELLLLSSVEPSSLRGSKGAHRISYHQRRHLIGKKPSGRHGNPGSASSAPDGARGRPMAEDESDTAEGGDGPSSLANLRGDVGSVTATLHAALGVCAPKALACAAYATSSNVAVPRPP